MNVGVEKYHKGVETPGASVAREAKNSTDII